MENKNYVVEKVVKEKLKINSTKREIGEPLHFHPSYK
jgi:hypothetical protein